MPTRVRERSSRDAFTCSPTPHGPGVFPAVAPAADARSAQGRAQPVLVDAPEVVLPAVDEGHRDVLAEAVRQVVVGGDVVLLEGLPQVGADALDDHAGVVAQVAARAAVERDPGRAHAGVLHSRSPWTR